MGVEEGEFAQSAAGRKLLVAYAPPSRFKSKAVLSLFPRAKDTGDTK